MIRRSRYWDSMPRIRPINRVYDTDLIIMPTLEDYYGFAAKTRREIIQHPLQLSGSKLTLVVNNR